MRVKSCRNSAACFVEPPGDDTTTRNRGRNDKQDTDNFWVLNWCSYIQKFQKKKFATEQHTLDLGLKFLDCVTVRPPK